MRSSKVLFTLLFSLLAVVQSFSQSADDVINNYIKAIGGLDKLKAINTMRVTAKVSAGPMEIPIIMTFKRPGMMMNELTIQGMLMKQAFDGTTAWAINPFGGKTEPEVLSEDQTKMFRQQSDLDGALVNYKEKGSTVELLGKEDNEGSEAYNLKVTAKDSTITNYFIDAESFMIVKQKNKYKMQDKEIEAEMIFSDYKPVNGILLAHAQEIKVPNNPMGNQKILIDKIEINIPVEDSFFKMTETKNSDTKKDTDKVK